MDSKLKLVPVENGKKYKLLDDYYCKVNRYIICVPKGFITDLASVPRIFWGIFPPFGRYTSATIVHDFLYSKYNATGINRTLADVIFGHLMKELKVDFFTRNTMYTAVRAFGDIAWQKKLSNEGYKDKALCDSTKEALEYYEKWDEILDL